MDEPKGREIYSELLALIVHDLRNPLSALRSNIGYLASVCQDSDARDAVEDAVVSCDGLAQILDNMDILIHVLNGNRALPGAPLLLGRLVEEVIDNNQPLAKSYGVSLELDGERSELNARVTANREMVGRALSNLVRNAIQFAGNTPVRVSLRGNDGRCSVLVADGGAPLNPELRELAFTARGQLAAKRMPHSRYSRGLGLYCARVAAQAAGGNVSVGAESASGNLFELSFPAA